MTDEGDEQQKGTPGKKRKEPGKRHGKPGKKARKASTPSRRKALNGRRRANMIFAIAHPVRRCIMRLYVEQEEALSPSQVARMLDLPAGMIAYHVTVLRRLGALEPASEQQVRGAIEHFYDSTVEDDPPIETLLEETRDVDEEDLERKKDG